MGDEEKSLLIENSFKLDILILKNVLVEYFPLEQHLSFDDNMRISVTASKNQPYLFVFFFSLIPTILLKSVFHPMFTLCKQYSISKVKIARMIPPKMTMKTPPIFLIEIPPTFRSSS